MIYHQNFIHTEHNSVYYILTILQGCKECELCSKSQRQAAMHRNALGFVHTEHAFEFDYAAFSLFFYVNVLVGCV